MGRTGRIPVTTISVIAHKTLALDQSLPLLGMLQSSTDIGATKRVRFAAIIGHTLVKPTDDRGCSLFDVLHRRARKSHTTGWIAVTTVFILAHFTRAHQLSLACLGVSESSTGEGATLRIIITTIVDLTGQCGTRQLGLVHLWRQTGSTITKRCTAFRVW